MSTSPSLFSHALAIIKNYPDAENLYVAYSGGMDSHVLLNLLVHNQKFINPKIIAVHINHGLSKESRLWAKHCSDLCEKLEVKYIEIDVDAAAPKGESQEEWSRKLRYDALKKNLNAGDILFTAHHKDDLAETLLLQLFRGAGPAGLSAIPEYIKFGEGWHIRPFLNITRKELYEIANTIDHSWIVDDSNSDERFDRNYLRHKIMPVINERWPGVLKTLSRSARIQTEVTELIVELAKIDLYHCINLTNNTLNQSCIKNLSDSRSLNLIRYWLKTLGQRSPSSAILRQILIDIVHSGPDASPCIKLDDIEIRRYRDMIFLTQNLPSMSQLDNEIRWDPDYECKLKYGKIITKSTVGMGISIHKIDVNELSIRYRDGHEKIKLGGHHHTLKNIFQEKGIPPCFRDLIPLIYMGTTLVEIAGLCINEDFQAKSDEQTLQVVWNRAEEVYAMKYIN